MAIDESVNYWVVGAFQNESENMLPEFLANGIWGHNNNAEWMANEVNTMEVGDYIFVKL